MSDAPPLFFGGIDEAAGDQHGRTRGDRPGHCSFPFCSKAGAWALRFCRVPVMLDFWLERAKWLGLDIEVVVTSPADAGEVFSAGAASGRYCRDCAGPAGQAHPESARVVIAAIEEAVASVRAGDSRALVTGANP